MDRSIKIALIIYIILFVITLLEGINNNEWLAFADVNLVALLITIICIETDRRIRKNK